MTIEQLMEKCADTLKLRLIAGREGLTNHIERVGVMETEDFVMASNPKGLFVLSTLSFAAKNPAALSAILMLIRSHPAGVAIKTRRFFSTIPDTIIDCAESCGVPLFEITEDIFFSKIVTEVTRMMASLDLVLDERIVNAAKTLRKYMNSEPLEDMLSYLSNLIDVACFFVDVQGSITSSQQSSSNYTEIGRHLLERGMSCNQTTKFITEGRTVAFLCRAGAVYLGVLVFPDAGSFTKEVEEIIELTLSYISVRVCELQISRTRSTLMSSHNLLDQIMILEHSDDQRVRNNIHELGFNLLEAYVFIELSIREEAIRQINPAFLIYCKSQFEARFDKIIAVTDVTGLRCLITFPTDDKLANSNALRYRLIAMCNSALSAHKGMIDIGISFIQNDASFIVQSSLQARHAISFGRLYKSDEYVHLYSDFILQGILRQSSELQEYKWIEQNVVNTITERDKNYQSGFWDTLDALFAEETLKNAADSLHLHISTLRYRINKINEITGFNFWDAYGYHVLHTAWLMRNNNA